MSSRSRSAPRRSRSGASAFFTVSARAPCPMPAGCPARSARWCATSPRSVASRSTGADSDESNESAYAELVEFVRVGAQLVFDELSPCARCRASPPAPRSTERMRIEAKAPTGVRAKPVPVAEFARRRTQLMRLMGPGLDRGAAVGTRAAAQQRCRLRLPPGQRLLLPDGVQRARVDRRAGAGPRAGAVHPLRARSRSRS